jgi:hypothetical protein
MCYMCMKDDVFGGVNPTNQQRLRERARQVKLMLAEAEDRRMEMCYVGDAAVELLKKEQYELAKQL